MCNTKVRAFIGLGSNLGDSLAHLRHAVRALESVSETRVMQMSSVYRSTPWGVLNQPDFLNAVVELETSLEPQVLLRALQKIEADALRTRETRWGPRTLDLDVLSYGTEIINTATLSIPHPRISERAFVLLPWAEIAPEFEVQGQGCVTKLLALLDKEGVTRLDGVRIY